MRRLVTLCFWLAVVGQGLTASAAGFDPIPSLNAYNVSWDVPGPGSPQSMPIGNGDIGLNVWVEPSGDLAFFIGKTDAWGPANAEPDGLMKLGGVHIAMSPSPLGGGSARFAQVLKLHEGEIDITEGSGPDEVDLRVWVDANHPVIRVEAKSTQPVSYKVTLDDWRKEDVTSQRIGPDQVNQIVWFHRNPNRPDIDPHVANITFGAVLKGAGLMAKGERELDSSTPTTAQLISIVSLSATTDTPGAFLGHLGQLMAQIDTLDLARTYAEHLKWWNAFWHRSWIFAGGPKEAVDVTRGYILQRFVTACAGRGAYPVRFNGSIFVIDDPTHTYGPDRPAPFTADCRDWGCYYWYQNTRAMYWPRLQAGDYDELMPLFRMYATITKNNEKVVKAYYGHDGSYFGEQRPFWGDLKYVGPQMPASWNDHYFTDVLDLGLMMLDYVEYSGDTAFLKQTAVPMITDGLTFFREHFYLGPDGRLLLDPDNAIEMYWKAHDPAPDIAGLHAILARMLALPDDVVDVSTRATWEKMQATLPDLPMGRHNGQRVLLPYAGPQTMPGRNGENPELYAVFPFRLYGVGQPNLDLAIRTFNHRRCTQKGCWVQDPIDAAMLGLTDVAADYVHFNLVRTDPRQKFWASWARGNDYPPDEDNGGTAENGLQQMLLQAVGRKLLLFPAWPKTWDVDFKLRAPYQTTVQASFRAGKMVNLVVDPPNRQADVTDMSMQPVASAPPVGVPGTVMTILRPGDPIVPLEKTAEGQPNILAATADITAAENAAKAIDGNTATKYFNPATALANTDPNGVDTGFVVTPAAGGPVTKVQLATGDDRPGRDPLGITVEGSDDPNAGAAGGNGFTLLYEGSTGLETDPGRNSWGPVIRLTHPHAYKTYRILVTQTRDDPNDAAQYSEVRLGN